MKGKCFDCGKIRKLYTLLVDPDIDVENRCKDCTREFQERLIIEICEMNEGFNTKPNE